MNYRKYALTAINLVLCHAHAAPNRFLAEGVECLIVEQASIYQRGLKPEGIIGMANVGHQIIPGPNLVLAIRAFRTALGVDTDEFTKAMMEFAPPKQYLEYGKPWNVKVLRSYYSDGYEGFLPDSHTWAINPFKTFKLIRAKGVTIKVAVESNIEVTDADGVSKRRQKIAWSCPIKPRQVWQLDEWEGKANPTDGTQFKPNYGALIRENFPKPAERIAP